MPVGIPSTIVSLSSWGDRTEDLEIVWMDYYLCGTMRVLENLQILVFSMQSIPRKQIKAEVSIMIRSSLCMALG